MELQLLDQVCCCDGGLFPGDTDGSLSLQGPAPPLPSSSKLFSPRSPSLSSVSASACLLIPGTFFRAIASKLCWCMVFPMSQAQSAAGQEVSRTCVFSHPRPPPPGTRPCPGGTLTHVSYILSGFSFLRVDLEETVTTQWVRRMPPQRVLGQA